MVPPLRRKSACSPHPGRASGGDPRPDRRADCDAHIPHTAAADGASGARAPPHSRLAPRPDAPARCPPRRGPAAIHCDQARRPPPTSFDLSVESVVGGDVSLSVVARLSPVDGTGKGDRFVTSSSPRPRRGPVTRQGRSELASGAGRGAALTGNVAVGGSQSTKRFPVSCRFGRDAPGSARGRPNRTQIEIMPDPRLRHKRQRWPTRPSSTSIC